MIESSFKVHELVIYLIVPNLTTTFLSSLKNKCTFQNICLEDNSIILNDEAQKIILNSKGIMNDLSDELLEFLAYVEDSTTENLDIAKK